MKLQVQVFRGTTMAEVLAQVKRSLGPGAAILHTRTYYERYCCKLRRREIVEVTAAHGLQIAQKSRAADVRPALRLPAVPPANGNIPFADARRALLDRPEVSNIMARELMKEVEDVKTLVKGISNQIRLQHSPDVPPELFDDYRLMIDNHLEEDLALEIVKAIQRTLRPEHLLQRDFVKEKLAEQIEKLVPVAGPITRVKERGPHVVALIGPTGVGKTTTIAKLAANLKVKQHRRVGLVTIDTYRIAAVDQIQRYADILDSSLRVVRSAQDLQFALEQMRDCDFVLVDTAGRSPNDTLKIGELRNFIRTGGVDEVHLVLSTTSSQSALDLAADRFGDVRIDKIIFTKLDEATNVGTLVSLTRRMNKALSYITTGQDVPDDIEVARGRRIAQLILGCEL